MCKRLVCLPGCKRERETERARNIFGFYFRLAGRQNGVSWDSFTGESEMHAWGFLVTALPCCIIVSGRERRIQRYIIYVNMLVCVYVYYIRIKRLIYVFVLKIVHKHTNTKICIYMYAWLRQCSPLRRQKPLQILLVCLTI